MILTGGNDLSCSVRPVSGVSGFDALTVSHGLRFGQTCFWVRHRRREYGPFDYEWSQDLRGVELTYQGVQFGEYCSDEELFADLKEFSLPMCVVEVASIVLGCIIYGVLHGLDATQRRQMMIDRLRQLGHETFATEIENKPDAA